jgi:hypothetical protein
LAGWTVQNVGAAAQFGTESLFILCIAILSRWAGALVPIVGARVLLVTGPLVTAAGFALAALRDGTSGGYWTTFFPVFLTMGLGMAITVAPLVTVVMGSVPPGRAGVASGINNAVSRAAGLVVLALMGLLILGAFNQALDRQLARLELGSDLVAHLQAERVNLAAAAPPAAATAEEAVLIRTAVQDAFLVAFRLTMLVAAGLAGLGAVVAWRTIEGRAPQPVGSRRWPHTPPLG